jgi:hypothetical protein
VDLTVLLASPGAQIVLHVSILEPWLRLRVSRGALIVLHANHSGRADPDSPSCPPMSRQAIAREACPPCHPTAARTPCHPMACLKGTPIGCLQLHLTRCCCRPPPRSLKEEGLFDYLLVNDDLEVCFKRFSDIAARALAGLDAEPFQVPASIPLEVSTSLVPATLPVPASIPLEGSTA